MTYANRNPTMKPRIHKVVLLKPGQDNADLYNLGQYDTDNERVLLLRTARHQVGRESIIKALFF